MKVIREQLAFLVAIGIFVMALFALTEQTELYRMAYQCLSEFLSHSSIAAKAEE